MIRIITDKRAYIWNYKRLLNNLLTVAGAIIIILSYLYLSNLDYLTLISKQNIK